MMTKAQRIDRDQKRSEVDKLAYTAYAMYLAEKGSLGDWYLHEAQRLNEEVLEIYRQPSKMQVMCDRINASLDKARERKVERQVQRAMKKDLYGYLYPDCVELFQ